MSEFRDYRQAVHVPTTPWPQKPAMADLPTPIASERGSGNLVLEQLAMADRLALQPRLERVSLSAGEVLIRPRSTTTHVYFPITALVSVSAHGAWGKAVEVALVGRDGIAGVGVMLGMAESPGLESVVHVEGSAWRVAVSELAPLLEERPGLRATLLQVVHKFLAQVSDSAVSIGSGTIEQRLARRLLMTSLKLGSDRLALTHEALARLMAVRRSGITVALHALEAQRIIRSRRNLVEILDYDGLARAAGDLGTNAVEARGLPAA
jgi:CRP-like cAMP-binding protein